MYTRLSVISFAVSYILLTSKPLHQIVSIRKKQKRGEKKQRQVYMDIAGHI
jgi:hypothetical protein